MQSNYAVYDHAASIKRIDDILDSSDNVYDEVDSIPGRDKLTFDNGFYANCTAVFIDLRNSSDLPNKHTRPRLAKIYRSYISECVAVLNGNSDAREVNIHGDAVWAVFNTPLKPDIDSVFSTAVRLQSLMDTLNCRLRKRGIPELRAGIGMSYGRALMIKAGYKGSAINDIVWMGDVVNEAAHLSADANKGYNFPLMVSNVIYDNLNNDNKKLLAKNAVFSCYHGFVVNVQMDEWIKKNCK